MKKRMIAIGVASLFLSLQSCEVQQEDVAGDQSAEVNSNQEGAEVAQQILEEFNAGDGEGGSGIQAVDYNVLKECMREHLAGFNRTDVTGERVSVTGYSIAQAHAEYQRADETLSVKILDIGTLTDIAKKAMTQMLAVHIEQESDNGFQRTMEVGGHKGFVEFTSSATPPELSATVFAYGRFLVEIDGNIDPSMLDAVIDELELGKLEDEARMSAE